MLSVSQRAARIVQAGIRAMSIECERANGINLATDDLEAATPVERTSSASASPSETTSWRKRADDWRTLA